MEQAFVWDAPDLAAMDEGQAQAWWDSSITFPEDFTYIAEDRSEIQSTGSAGACVTPRLAL